MKGVKSAKERSKEVERTRKEVSHLLIRYTEFVRPSHSPHRDCRQADAVYGRRARSLSYSWRCIGGWRGSRRMSRGWNGVGGRRSPDGSEARRRRGYLA